MSIRRPVTLVSVPDKQLHLSIQSWTVKKMQIRTIIDKVEKLEVKKQTNKWN